VGRRAGGADPHHQQRFTRLERLGRRPYWRARLYERRWVVGDLANNVWSFGGTHGPLGNSYNNFLTQPFVNYNFGEGWYVVSAPIVTANWETPGTKWTVPIGGGAGRVFKVGKLPINFSLSAYYNIVKPQYAGDWQLRTQLTFIF